MSDPVKAHIRVLLTAEAAHNEATTAKIREIEAAGGLIISWQTRGKSEGQWRWEIADWRTGETLAASADYDSRDEALDSIPCPGEIWNIERVWDAVDHSPPPPPEGLPESLADAIEDWLGYAATTDGDVAAFIG